MVSPTKQGLCAKQCLLSGPQPGVHSRMQSWAHLGMLWSLQESGASPHGTRDGCIKVHYWDTLHRIFGLILKFIQHIFPKEKKPQNTFWFLKIEDKDNIYKSCLN